MSKKLIMLWNQFGMVVSNLIGSVWRRAFSVESVRTTLLDVFLPSNCIKVGQG